VDTLGDVHKLYTSQLIAVMVKEKNVKTNLTRLILEKTRKCGVFAITNFTIAQNCKKNSIMVWFCISSRSLGVSPSQ
jgi:hypothetical protein